METMEEEINKIVEKRFEEILSGEGKPKTTMKLAVLDGYRAGMEAAQKVYKS